MPTSRPTARCSGPSEQIAAALAADPALRDITDLLISFVPGVPDHTEHLRLLTAGARELAPLLGWHSSSQLLPV